LQTLHPLALPGAVPPAWSPQASRKELLQRAAAAQSDVREERLRRCVEEAERQNFVQAAHIHTDASMNLRYIEK